ncbi:MAG TPA: hypothetical protein VHV75_07770 [Solirubrobacteraceae bacterium]|nr:hypothetical protein [Solirubrobacteraceae bacterium]
MTNDIESEEEPVTDVLAAEEFVVPAPDPALRPERLKLPPDQVGDKPHDVLAAEEFAMPAPDEAHEPPPSGRRLPAVRLIAINLPPVLLALWLWRRVRRRARRKAA